VIATGDTLDGSTVQNLTFCEEGLSDSGELAFVAQLDDPKRLRIFAPRSFAPHRSSGSLHEEEPAASDHRQVR
jgi:hypothetical protein